MKNESLSAELIRKRKNLYRPLRFLLWVVCDRTLLLAVTLLLPDFLAPLMVLLLLAGALLRLAVLLAAFLLPLMLWLCEPGFFLRVAVVFDPAALDPALRAPLRSFIPLI